MGDLFCWYPVAAGHVTGNFDDSHVGEGDAAVGEGTTGDAWAACPVGSGDVAGVIDPCPVKEGDVAVVMGTVGAACPAWSRNGAGNNPCAVSEGNVAFEVADRGTAAGMASSGAGDAAAGYLSSTCQTQSRLSYQRIPM